jgi:hypothetical protein
MITYIFRRTGNGPPLEGELERAVRTAIKEVRNQGVLYSEDAVAIETPDSDGGYVLLSIDGVRGWHYHQESVFSRHGITCAYYPKT